MTLPASGPISMSMLNTEFNRTSTLQLSFSDAFAGTYAQYGAINRNTLAGRDIYNYNITGSNLFLTAFYNYNDTATVHWYYNFDATGTGTSPKIEVTYATSNMYNATLTAGTTDSANNVDSGISSGASAGDITLSLNTGGIPNFVDINCYDYDTLTTIYSITGDSPNNYGGGSIGTIYGYQRFALDLTFYD